jgi:hypothetical protein
MRTVPKKEPDRQLLWTFYVHNLGANVLLADSWVGATKTKRIKHLGLVGAVGIEPTTFGLKGRCSTTELRP